MSPSQHSTEGEWWENLRIWTLRRLQLHELNDSEETLYKNNVAHTTKIIHCQGDNPQSWPSITVLPYVVVPHAADISFFHAPVPKFMYKLYLYIAN